MRDDLRLALRRLRQAPGFTAMAVVTLALALGANTAVLSIADAVLFRPLPYHDADRVYLLRTSNPTTGRRSAAVPRAAVEKINEHHHGLGQIADLVAQQIVPHTTGDETEHVSTVTVSPTYFQVLGVRAARGRLLGPEDVQDPGGRAVLSYRSWRQRYAGDESIVGRVLRLGSRTREVVGVLPEGFIFPSEYIQFPWGVSGAPEYITVSAPLSPRAGGRPVVNPIVRLEHGATREQAQSELDALLAGEAKPGAPPARVILDDIRAVVFPVARSTMTFLVAAAVLVLLLGSANLANMFLARGRRRERDIGVSLALGATRARIVRPIIFEAVAIALMASVAALALTALTFETLARQVPPLAYGMARVGPDLRVAGYALILSLACGFLFGALPAWQLSRRDALGLLRRSAHTGRTKVHGRTLVAVQIAFAVVLAFGAAIAARAFLSVLNVPIGFDPHNVLVIEVRPDIRDRGQLLAFYARAIEQLEQRADVISAGGVASLPLSTSWNYTTGRAEPEGPESDVVHILPGYFETLRIPILRGRSPNASDLASVNDVAVVSESAARMLFLNGDAIGRTLTIQGGRAVTVVGVAQDVHSSFERKMRALAYAIDDARSARPAIVVRMQEKGPEALARIRRMIGQAAPGAPVSARWLDDVISSASAYRNPRFQTLVLGGFAVLALILTGLGTFALVASLVAGLTREVGIRIAIGASARSIVRLIVSHAVPAVVAGGVAGAIMAWWAGRFAESQLYQVQARDAGALGLSVLVIAAAAGVAAYLPARAAARVDPIAVLRAE